MNVKFPPRTPGYPLGYPLPVDFKSEHVTDTLPWPDLTPMDASVYATLVGPREYFLPYLKHKSTATNDHLRNFLMIEGDHSGHLIKQLVERPDVAAEIRGKADNGPDPVSFHHRILFEEPSGGTGDMNVASRAGRPERQGHRVRDDVYIDTVPQRSRGFPRALRSPRRRS